MTEINSEKGAYGSFEYKCLPWQCSIELSNVFGANGVSLIGYLRAPKYWTETQEEAEMPW